MKKNILKMITLMAVISCYAIPQESLAEKRNFLKKGNKRLDTEARFENEALESFKEYMQNIQKLGQKNIIDFTYQDVEPLYREVKYFRNNAMNHMSNKEKAEYIKNAEDYLHLAREFPQYFSLDLLNPQQNIQMPSRNEETIKPFQKPYNESLDPDILDPQQNMQMPSEDEEKLRLKYQEFYNKLLDLSEKEKHYDGPKLKFFHSENPDFLKEYEKISKNLSLGEIVRLAVSRLPLRIKEFFYKWTPLPGKMQEKIPEKKRDRVDEYVEKVSKNILNERFLERIKNKHPEISSMDQLKDFARQLYDLDSEDREFTHAPERYWFTNKYNSVKNAIDNFSSTFSPFKVASNQIKKSSSKLEEAKNSLKSGIKACKDGIGCFMSIPIEIGKNLSHAIKTSF